MTGPDQRIRLRIRVYGIVQGIGFRPFVARLADAYKISGSVCNKGSFVEIFAEGSRESVFSFYKALPERAPAVSAIVRIDQKELPPEGAERFLIIKSSREAGEIFVSPDLAICPACRKELFDPSNKRYLHPFINCTDCGPRLTILDSMPYDRVRTSMGVFPMCPDCEREYTDPGTRRFHAQPVCCNDCGPRVYIPGREESGPDAIRLVRKVIREGGIAAIKGIGGFHLCCDATSDQAVARLRALKNRPAKPFAVMMRDIGTVERECEIPDGFRGFLEGVQKPILILDRKEGGRISPLVAPDNPTVGVMLPYAPIQMLLFSYPEENSAGREGEKTGAEPEMTDVFVMTSGNPSGAPICKDDDEAVRYLSPMCDVILSNDRTIRLRADDSVMQAVRGKPYMIRRSRGYAPLPVVLPEGTKGELLAVGGELKNTFALAKDELVYPSAYIGDLADLRSVNALSAAVERMEELLETKPRAVVCDLHPRYNSSAFAEELSLPVIRVQHHYAHILSCMAENRWTDPCIGISFDGTGYGTDGTVWGGEFLIAWPDHFICAGSLAPFLQSGGDLASKEGWRIAVSLLADAADSEEAFASAVKSLGLCSEQELKMQTFMRRNGVNTVQSTSAGRLFDAVSAMLG
ncbi:MAG: carbamoyltransferase HypF, partial [Lachnospiraceae bacterium]|nr:carbamoyltransferase HypF [Lachnospiraceae bacterium]